MVALMAPASVTDDWRDEGPGWAGCDHAEFMLQDGSIKTGRIGVDSYWDGESSYPVYEIEFDDRSPPVSFYDINGWRPVKRSAPQLDAGQFPDRRPDQP